MEKPHPQFTFFIMSGTKRLFSGGSAIDKTLSASEDNSSPEKSVVKLLEEYDESSYPADAEEGPNKHSDDQDESDLTEVSRAQYTSRASGEGLEEEKELPLLSDDILCAVCAEVFFEPCTLHCGHSFCQLCLAALWKSSRKKSLLSLSCPVCRQPWVNFPGVNIQLRYIVTLALVVVCMNGHHAL